MPYEIVATLAVNVTKVSILLFILRIKNTRPMRIIIWTTIVTMSIVSIMMSIVFAVQCIPISKLWKPDTPGSCLSIRELTKFGYVQCAFASTTDLLCSISPVVFLWKMKIHIGKKIGVCLLMSLGLIATAGNIYRTVKFELLFHSNCASNLAARLRLITKSACAKWDYRS